MDNRADAIAVEPSPHGFGRLFGALAHHPYYRTYWIGNQASTLAMQMQLVAQGYLAFLLTGSAAALGVIGLAQGLPQLFFSPLGGVIADRYPKRDVLIVVQVILCLNSLVIGTLVVLHVAQYWHLAITAFVQGMCISVNMPARQSWIPSLVPKVELANAIALNNAGLNASRIIGPALAGLLIAVPGFNVQGVYYTRFIAAAWVLYSFLQIPIRGDTMQKRSGRMFQEMTAGLRYIWKHETLAPLFTLAVVTLLLGSSYQLLLPAYALRVFSVGSAGLGFMMTAVGTGAICGSLSMAYLSRSEHKGRIQAVAGTCLGLMLFCFGVASALKFFPLALLALFFVGMSNDFYSTINNTLIMVNTDGALYGRVMSAYMMVWSLSSLSAAPFGVLMDTVGGAPTMWLIGGVLAVFVVGMALFHPGYRRIT